jgi:hypothetical protein
MCAEISSLLSFKFEGRNAAVLKTMAAGPRVVFNLNKMDTNAFLKSSCPGTDSDIKKERGEKTDRTLALVRLVLRDDLEPWKTWNRFFFV